MKKCFLAAVIGFTGLVSANVPEIKSDVSEVEDSQTIHLFKRIKIDETITDTHGTQWHIYGWVDVSISWSGPKINHYDVHMTGGGYHYHFQGKVVREELKDGTIRNTIDGSLTDEDSGTEVAIDSNIKTLLYQLNENVIRNNPE
ncbi:hypothetical protein SD427_07065 [Chryseobacterium sp. JJR-5R]|uniref:hypothetical protein n=1 Tax=Chryseobacterium sp. JJR-5R TaxID=3093923 RepID=UPI002A7581AD|nr:hypothetical protein [Chryseobacterium sp. JJR-5R]WPO84086.1 hypothetical protein SD427_07065 [Chryseobacterium sp. JJR-5R]